jgi:hypothetical protein
MGYSLFNLKIKWREIIETSVVMGIAAYILPRLPIIPGLHTVILIFGTTIFISWLTNIKVLYNLIAIMCGAMIMGVTENLVVSLILNVLSKDVGDLSSHPWLNISVSLLIILLVTVVCLLAKRYGWVLYDLDAEGI